MRNRRLLQTAESLKSLETTAVKEWKQIRNFTPPSPLVCDCLKPSAERGERGEWDADGVVGADSIQSK